MPITLRCTVVVLALASFCGAQTHPTAQPAPFDASGIVTDTAGKPIAGAHISCYLWGRGSFEVFTPNIPLSKTATTDADGRFTLRDIQLEMPDQAFSVVAIAPGMAWAKQMAYLRSPRHDRPGFRDEEAGTMRDIAWLVLAPAIMLHGSVIDDDGRPVADAKIFDGIPRDPQVKTDVNGNFALDRVPPLLSPGSRYGTISIEHPDFASDHFSAGTNRREGIVLRIRRGLLISGKLTRADTGAAITDASVRAQVDGDTTHDRYASVDATGHYSLRVPAGRIELKATVTARTGAQLRRPMLCTNQPIKFEAKRDDDRADVDFTFVPTKTAIGTLVGMPFPQDLIVEIFRLAPNGERGERFGEPLEVSPDNKFEFPRLDPGKYVVVVSLKDQSHEFDARQIEITNFDDFGGVLLQQNGAVHREIGKRPAVQGRVVNADGKPAVRSRVLAFWQAEAGGPWLADGGSRADLDGTFELRNVDQTKALKIVAWDAKQQFAGFVDVAPSGKFDAVQLTQRTSRITGTVRDPAGKPVVGRPVKLMTGHDVNEIGGEICEAVTDSAGKYSIDGYFPAGLPLSIMPMYSQDELGRDDTRDLGWSAIYRRFPVEPGKTLDRMDFVEINDAQTFRFETVPERADLTKPE